MKSQLNHLKKIDLSHIGTLYGLKDLRLAVPGTYEENETKVTRIKRFVHSVEVMVSKQKPRKLTIIGDNDKRYVFLLKGKEDLRQGNQNLNPNLG